MYVLTNLPGPNPLTLTLTVLIPLSIAFCKDNHKNEDGIKLLIFGVIIKSLDMIVLSGPCPKPHLKPLQNYYQ